MIKYNLEKVSISTSNVSTNFLNLSLNLNTISIPKKVICVFIFIDVSMQFIFSNAEVCCRFHNCQSVLFPQKNILTILHLHDPTSSPLASAKSDFAS